MSQPAGRILSPKSHDEAHRVAHLRGLDLLHSPAEPVFDRLTGIAREQLETGFAGLSLVDADRLWFKSVAGALNLRQTPANDGFCAWTILTEDALVVEDASADPRFARNPLVAGEPYVRFYAGAPIRSCGHAIGALAVLDRRPRRLGDREQQLLGQLAATAAEVIELRRTKQERVAIGEMLDAAVEEAYLFDVHANRIVYTNTGGQRRIGHSIDELERMNPQQVSSAYDRRSLVRIIDTLRAGKRSVVTECRHRRQDGSEYPVETRFV
jgi:PAS domain S-box-containing protein